MRRTTLYVSSLALLLQASAALAQERLPIPDPRPEVETVGTGERRVAPDRATTLLMVQSKALTAATAASENARVVQAVRDTLRQLGLTVATGSYNVGTDYEPRPTTRNDPPRPIGYVARTVLRVQLTHIDQVGRTIDAGLARGATGVQGVVFESSMMEETRRAALADAAVAARRDAEALARALGGTLGPLLSSSTVGANDPRRSNVMMRAAYSDLSGYGVSTEMTPAEIVVTAGVVTRWRFVPN